MSVAVLKVPQSIDSERKRAAWMGIYVLLFEYFYETSVYPFQNIFGVGDLLGPHSPSYPASISSYLLGTSYRTIRPPGDGGPSFTTLGRQTPRLPTCSHPPNATMIRRITAQNWRFSGIQAPVRNATGVQGQLGTPRFTGSQRCYGDNRLPDLNLSQQIGDDQVSELASKPLHKFSLADLVRYAPLFPLKFHPISHSATFNTNATADMATHPSQHQHYMPQQISHYHSCLFDWHIESMH